MRGAVTFPEPFVDASGYLVLSRVCDYYYYSYYYYYYYYYYYDFYYYFYYYY